MAKKFNMTVKMSSVSKAFVLPLVADSVEDAHATATKLLGPRGVVVECVECKEAAQQ